MKIEYRDLVAMGATEKQLETYSNTDPLTIVQDTEGFYQISGAVEYADLSAQEVLAVLDGLRESWDEE